MMGLTVPNVTVFIALLISVSATYNAYILRGGKLAWSELLIALGMIALIISQVADRFLPDPIVIAGLTITDVLYILGFICFLIASFNLRASFKS